MGQWQGTGSGFGNATSQIMASFTWIMDGRYLEVRHDSRFEPTEQNPKGEHHVDQGMISFDKHRERLVYRQFNSEGYVNQYVLSDSLSGDSTWVFVTEAIENFVPNGQARWTVRRLGPHEMETVFEVSFPGRPYACFGTNRLKRNSSPGHE